MGGSAGVAACAASAAPIGIINILKYPIELARVWPQQEGFCDDVTRQAVLWNSWETQGRITDKESTGVSSKSLGKNLLVL